MRVVFTRRALRELNELLAYVSRQDPVTADKMSAAIDARIESCARNPRFGSATDKRNVFRAPISRYRVTVVYRLRPVRDELEILRVTRGKRIRRRNAPA